MGVWLVLKSGMQNGFVHGIVFIFSYSSTVISEINNILDYKTNILALKLCNDSCIFFFRNVHLILCKFSCQN